MLALHSDLVEELTKREESFLGFHDALPQAMELQFDIPDGEHVFLMSAMRCMDSRCRKPIHAANLSGFRERAIGSIPTLAK